MASVPLHEKAPLTLTSSRTRERLRGCLDMLVGTKIPKNHEAILKAITAAARMHDIVDDPEIKLAIGHVESERLVHVAHSG